jgi:hypothetical protein
LKPGDTVHTWDDAFGDTNLDRLTVSGALQTTALNGTYAFSILSSNTSNNITTSTLQIATPNVANGTYAFVNEPQLAIAYGGPVSSSGSSDLPGGDSTVTFGLWPASDVAGCHANPSAGPPYCDNQVGNIQAQAGTLMHELGHTLNNSHGGTYYANELNNPPAVPTYGLNCKPNRLSVMSYAFQARGFPDGSIGYAEQVFLPLDETNLSEMLGIGLGTDVFGNSGTALHPTRWYGPPNPASGDPAIRHCDGTPLKRDSSGAVLETQLVRIDGPTPGGTFSSPIDWNNDLVAPNAVNPPGVDVNFNGILGLGGDSLFLGLNDWAPAHVPTANGTLYGIGVDLRQIDARRSSFGLSGAGTVGGDNGTVGGDNGTVGGDNGTVGGDNGTVGGDNGTVGGDNGAEQDYRMANSSVDAPTGLQATWNKTTKAVDLQWNLPVFGQDVAFYIYRLDGNPPTTPLTNSTPEIKILQSTPPGSTPPSTYSDTTVKPNSTYTYYVKAQIAPDPGQTVGRKSNPSNPAPVTTK